MRIKSEIISQSCVDINKAIYKEKKLVWKYGQVRNHLPVPELANENKPGQAQIKPGCSHFGFATIVQGTIVQVHICPSRWLSKGQFSKQIFVPGDFCPRSKIYEVKASHKILFLQHITHLYGESQKKKKNQFEQAFKW